MVIEPSKVRRHLFYIICINSRLISTVISELPYLDFTVNSLSLVFPFNIGRIVN